MDGRRLPSGSAQNPAYRPTRPPHPLWTSFGVEAVTSEEAGGRIERPCVGGLLRIARCLQGAAASSVPRVTMTGPLRILVAASSCSAFCASEIIAVATVALP